jgi:NADP-dependent aldehyde dehydrogenase
VLAKGAVDSALLGSGQFCTKPGLFILPASQADTFLAEVEKYLGTLSVGPLLNKGIADRYSKVISELSKKSSIKVYSGTESGQGLSVSPTFFVADWKTISSTPELLEEHFGPTTVLALANESEYLQIAQSLEGQLTATIQGTDTDSLKPLIAALAECAGRVIWNGFPTGVSVTGAMQHGGQWPSSSSHTTSVGTDAIYRFMRPVSYQGLSQANLPKALQDSNPWGVPQQIS